MIADLTDLRTWLRGLPSFERDRLPPFDPEDAPADPADLFLTWLRDAVAVGSPAPHAMNLATADAAGAVTARTLILKDLDARGWHFATGSHSPKAAALAQNPNAAMTSFWPALGRQVRLTGIVHDLGEEAGAADFLARPPTSRAAALVGRQSEPLASRQEYWDAYAAALARVEADVDGVLVAPEWRVYALTPHTVEFWAATPDAGQIRLRYRRSADGPSADRAWTKGLIWP
ncbi:pyridoxal 5'-phosphate synthase [Occultella aeris]|uniref:Pyridoxine/pyridoxamine 5'-phosphate oxidase n=1 Tax=Occultella aeris TaxID=2761496 RepID=A0A7M4DH52_9MICO|nr:pyridoxal 5'-phosphate synthase [Occultella aeris]VZO36245.1 Pyridoxine/pyridoxamine 5'-phosphate oxidase [Occultella aeris]